MPKQNENTKTQATTNGPKHNTTKASSNTPAETNLKKIKGDKAKNEQSPPTQENQGEKALHHEKSQKKILLEAKNSG
ncbi:hypothetical protein [Bacteroides graminisolvens]|uniref:hypothetical protein n=1 Tax=Bacteroides graminisolvens TaxID=477666 RepID=UPI0003FC09E8|nr:hypothetical protein [Bacteroides graminisolvens]